MTASRTTRLAGVLTALLVVLTAWTGTAPNAAATPPAVRPYRSCATKVAGHFRCASTWRPTGATASAQRRSSSTARVPKPPAGVHPTDVRKAYRLPTRGAKNQTVAIVDAYDNPRVEADLAVYRSAFGLGACTTANGCFRKVDERGGTTYPVGDPGWGVEIDLDVQAVSASCRSCRILLVEADDSSFEALGRAENTAVRLGATVVSNSYGTDEFGGMWDYARRFYTHPGVPILASTGDFGFTAASFPAVLRSTWAIGGTFLSKHRSSYAEEAWEEAGSGCSAYVGKPAVQKDRHCSMRTVADVSAVADSDDGYIVYDTFGLGDESGWGAVSGTSVSAPLVAGMIGLAGNAAAVASPAYPYTHPKGLHDVRGGSNGECGGDYLCTGVKGYDAPTGLGSPRGLSSL